MRELGPGYVSEIDAVNEGTWWEILEEFDDANIYQTWSYAVVRYGRQHTSHLVLKEKGEIVAAAESRITRVPFLDVGVAYIRWGPLWRLRNAEAKEERFRQAIRALRNEYVCTRGLVLRLFPMLFDSDAPRFLSILEEEGFSRVGQETWHQTILVDLTRSLRDLRQGLRQHWRRGLNAAERNRLEVVEGHGDELFETFIRIYREMASRKGLAGFSSINELRAIQGLLPEKFKMKIMLCRSGDDLCAGLVCSAMGKTAIYLLGATSNSGMKSRGSYLLHWKLIEGLKRDPRVTVYDLNGVNPKTNAGMYRFKNDLSGENGRHAYVLGRFDSHPNVLSCSWVACGDTLRAIYRALWENGRARLALLDPRRRDRALAGEEHHAGHGHRRDGTDDHREAPARASGRFSPPAEPDE